jgi:hypothetical protein
MRVRVPLARPDQPGDRVAAADRVRASAPGPQNSLFVAWPRLRRPKRVSVRPAVMPVAGLVSGVNHVRVAQSGERLPYKKQVAGSIPAVHTKQNEVVMPVYFPEKRQKRGKKKLYRRKHEENFGGDHVKPKPGRAKERGFGPCEWARLRTGTVAGKGADHDLWCKTEDTRVKDVVGKPRRVACPDCKRRFLTRWLACDDGCCVSAFIPKHKK